MGNVIKAFTTADAVRHQRDWDTLYIALDIHGTVIKPNWDGIATEFYPDAIEGLKEICKDPIFKIIIWTCSKEEDRLEYGRMLEEAGIPIYAINSNPETDNVLNWGDYSKKIYCNILLDDKAGFDPETDWRRIIEYLKMKRNEKTEYKRR